MTHGQAIRITASPNPGEWCVNAISGRRCLQTIGRVFTPRSIRVRQGPVDIHATRSFQSPPHGMPVRVNVVFRNLGTGHWNIGPGWTDHLTVTGAAGGPQQWAFDDEVIDIT